MTPSEEVANLCRRLVFCLFQGFSHRLNLSLYRRPKLGTARTAKGQLRLRPYLASGRTVRSERKKGPKGVKGGSRGKGKINAQNVYTAQERSQAYLVNAERVAAGLG